MVGLRPRVKKNGVHDKEEVKRELVLVKVRVECTKFLLQRILPFNVYFSNPNVLEYPN